MVIAKVVTPIEYQSVSLICVSFPPSAALPPLHWQCSSGIKSHPGHHFLAYIRESCSVDVSCSCDAELCSGMAVFCSGLGLEFQGISYVVPLSASIRKLKRLLWHSLAPDAVANI